MFDIRQYQKTDEGAWNRFVAQSKQGTFLFDRSYMDYHSDRFADHSLLFFHKGNLRALLPANIEGDTLYSHQGLTYGGLLTDRHAKVADICTLFAELNDYIRNQGIHKVVYKAMPWIYHRLPAEEDLYALTQVCHAQLTVREVSSTIIGSHRLPFEESRRSGIRKAMRLGVSCSESTDFASFWQILDGNLSQKYGVHPVHTLKEMQLLHSRFPRNIRLYLATLKERPIGGTVIYETPQVIHTQYISATPEGKQAGALDLLFDFLINKVYAECPYFDFGKSTEDQGHTLNSNLIFQKEGFGGRGVCYDTYEWTL